MGPAALRVVTTHTAPKAFTVHARRWGVERAFAWLVEYRRLGKDHEFMTESSKAIFHFLSPIPVGTIALCLMSPD